MDTVGIGRCNSPSSLIEIYSDFICPYSYIFQSEADLLAETFGIEPRWRPLWLHPEVPLQGVMITDQERVRATLARLTVLSPTLAGRVTYPKRLPFSLPAFAAMEYANHIGKAAELRREIFDEIWVHQGDISTSEGLARAARRADIAEDKLLHAVRDMSFTSLALDGIISARERHIIASPTMVVGEIAIGGWQPYEVLEHIVEWQIRSGNASCDGHMRG